MDLIGLPSTGLRGFYRDKEGIFRIIGYETN
jgi:hypothetical protein